MLKKLLEFFFGKKLTKSEYNKFKKYQKDINKKNTPEERIIALDKLYHNILLSLGLKGSFGEILKKEPKQVSNLQDVWRLHKIRNSLVHDLDSKHSNLEKDAKRYNTLITNLLLKNLK